jgi:threonine dehydrogenase-like Zn-dependent dehydrogenase
MKSKRAFLIEPGRFEIREVEVSLGPDDLMIEVRVNGLCNWELNHFKGYIGKCPLTLGHEWAGIVVDVGKNVKGFAVGDYVTGMPSGGMTGFSEYLAAPASNCFKLDKSVNIETATLEPLKCIVTVLRGAEPEAGDFGVILGCGPMGLACVQGLSGNFLGGLIAVDVDDTKLQLAKKFGATATVNPATEDAFKRISEITGGRLADFVIEGTGIPALLGTALKYVKANDRGRLVLMSSHEETCKEFDFRVAIQKSIKMIVPHPGYSLNAMDDLRRAVNAFNKGVFNMEDLVTHKFKLDEIQKAFEMLEHKPKGYIKGVVLPGKK